MAPQSSPYINSTSGTKTAIPPSRNLFSPGQKFEIYVYFSDSVRILLPSCTRLLFWGSVLSYSVFFFFCFEIFRWTGSTRLMMKQHYFGKKLILYMVTGLRAQMVMVLVWNLLLSPFLKYYLIMDLSTYMFSLLKKASRPIQKTGITWNER